MDDLRYEITDHVGVLTIDRPGARNALRRQTYAELEAVVRSLVTDLGGRITLESEVGRGTTMRVWLPPASTAEES